MTENSQGLVVQRFVYRGPFVVATVASGRIDEIHGYEIRPACLEADAEAVAELALSLAAATSGAGPNPRPQGLMCELRSRPGRIVRCWLAWPLPVDNTPGQAGLGGLVTLVESRGRPGAARFSIGWLIVRPDARRLGLGRALVAAAVRHARSAGADVVWTETSRDWPAAEFWRAIGFVPSRSPGYPDIL